MRFIFILTLIFFCSPIYALAKDKEDASTDNKKSPKINIQKTNVKNIMQEMLAYKSLSKTAQDINLSLEDCLKETKDLIVTNSMPLFEGQSIIEKLELFKKSVEEIEPKNFPFLDQIHINEPFISLGAIEKAIDLSDKLLDIVINKETVESNEINIKADLLPYIVAAQLHKNTNLNAKVLNSTKKNIIFLSKGELSSILDLVSSINSKVTESQDISQESKDLVKTKLSEILLEIAQAYVYKADKKDDDKASKVKILYINKSIAGGLIKHKENLVSRIAGNNEWYLGGHISGFALFDNNGYVQKSQIFGNSSGYYQLFKDKKLSEEREDNLPKKKEEKKGILTSAFKGIYHFLFGKQKRGNESFKYIHKDNKPASSHETINKNNDPDSEVSSQEGAYQKSPTEGEIKK